MRRNAFTLIEILMVILLISILAGMVTAAVSAAGDTAKRSRTRAILATINDVLETKYESYKTRPLPVTAIMPGTPTAGQVSVEIPPRESARIRLNMIRDLMRMEMPDRISDVLDSPTEMWGAVRPVLFTDSSGNYEYTRGGWTAKRISWYSNADPPAALFSYRQRLPSNPADWSRAFESAECLYLIVSTTFMNGVPAISSIPSSNVGDTDGDGMPEILDGWGNPIGFIRWPVGYIESDGSVPGLGQYDEFDTFRVDWGYVESASGVPPAHPHPAFADSKPFSLKPLVVSAGPDREFGLRFGFGLGDYTTDIRYSQMGWPLGEMGTSPNDQRVGDSAAGRNARFRYVDPYDRHNSAGGSPRSAVGEVINANQRDDNITNYQLQETS